MSFQHFRLGELSLHQPLPPHLSHHQGTTSNINGAAPNHDSASQFVDNTFPNNPHKGHTNNSPSSGSKQPYGSGDTDDGYTLVFPNLDAFHDWRNDEEERQMVEFVKGDTHGSKAVPPRFKDHTKLVCARHSRSGRKKYVKKHPERVRKVPSRKLEGQGCPASISFKTYFDTDEVRVCYISQHSHEIGHANLPFTRRGRKAAAQRDKKKGPEEDSSTPAPTSSNANAVAGPSSTAQAQPYSSAIAMLAPLPSQTTYQPPPQPYGYPSSVAQPYPSPPPHAALSHDRWENMATLFHSVREHARGFEYPAVSVAALETILIRLYLESPVGVGPQPTMTSIMQNGMAHPAPTPPQPSANQSIQQPNNGSANSSASGSGVNSATGVDE